MISNKLKKVIELQSSTELDKLDYKKYDLNKVQLPSIFLQDIYTNNLSIENADHEQSDLYEWFNFMFLSCHSRGIWGLLAQMGSGFSKFSTT